MIIRIVKMTFQQDKTADFLKVFNESKHLIAGFEGCTSLKLLNDRNNPGIFFTYSHWESEENLEKYRNSELFASVWAKTKILFAAKAEAWSVNELFDSKSN